MYNQTFVKQLYESLTGYYPMTYYHPIDYAAEHGYLEVIQYLHLNTDEPCSIYAMNYAASNGHIEIVKFLYNNLNDDYDWDIDEAIEIAAEKGHTKIVKLLYKYKQQNESKLLCEL